tara:strand:- start:1488 stop:1766 length:279 start_codon:yes stop_codon:yes gene_type:complete
VIPIRILTKSLASIFEELSPTQTVEDLPSVAKLSVPGLTSKVISLYFTDIAYSPCHNIKLTCIETGFVSDSHLCVGVYTCEDDGGHILLHGV